MIFFNREFKKFDKGFEGINAKLDVTNKLLSEILEVLKNGV